MQDGCQKTLKGNGGKEKEGEMMVADTRPISERAQPDAYKLAARHESLYILIVADDNADSRVAMLFLVFPFSLSILSPFAGLFPPFHLFRTCKHVPPTPPTQLQTHRMLTLRTDLSSGSKIQKNYSVSKKGIFPLYILLFALVFNRLYNKLSFI